MRKWICLTLLFLTGCSLFPGLPDVLPRAVVNAEPTPTPLPTSQAPDFSVVESPACLVTTLSSLHTGLSAIQRDLTAWKPQGDLMRFSPADDSLAFVAPGGGTNWFLGRLRIATGTKFDVLLNPAPDAGVFGDLTWAPDGAQLAFVAFRNPDVYTILTVAPREGATPMDLFPDRSAYTDTWGSSKAIREWTSAGLIGLSACGDDCDQAYRLDPAGAPPQPYGEQTRRVPGRLDPTRSVPAYDEAIFPKKMLLTNWAPGGERMVFVQGADFTLSQSYDRVWVVSIAERRMFEVSVERETPVETQWSRDGSLLAVRTEDRIYVYRVACK